MADTGASHATGYDKMKEKFADANEERTQFKVRGRGSQVSLSWTASLLSSSLSANALLNLPLTSLAVHRRQQTCQREDCAYRQRLSDHEA
jgi:hypothetical protein